MTNYRFHEGPIYFAPTPKVDGTYIYNKSSPDPPDAPDYKGAAEATGASNLAAVNAQTLANRANQVTPWGTSTWTQADPGTAPTFDQAAYDRDVAAWEAKQGRGGMTNNPPRFGDDYSISDYYTPRSNTANGTRPSRDDYWTKATPGSGQWTQKIELTPEQQAALDSQMKIQMNQMGLAQGLQAQVAEMMKSGFVGPELQAYMDKVGDVPEYNDAWRNQNIQSAYNLGYDLNKDQWSQQQKSGETQLRLQGLTPGTEAYDNAMQNIFRTQNAAKSNLTNQSILTGSQLADSAYQRQLAGQNQQFAQAQQGYQTAYTAALQKYLQPLNNMNAVINGQQVGMPQFPQYAQAGNPGGINYTGATSALGDWNTGVYNSQVGAANSSNNAFGSILGAGLTAFGGPIAKKFF